VSAECSERDAKIRILKENARIEGERTKALCEAVQWDIDHARTIRADEWKKHVDECRALQPAVPGDGVKK
jgi:hypothetical protein